MSSSTPGRGRAPVRLSWDQAIAWRLGRQRLLEPRGDVVRLVGELGGVQAQVASGAEHVVAVRSGATPGDVGDLLWRWRALVKTWAMRGTLHLLPSSEYPVWVAALRAREWRITPGWERYHGVSAGELNAITKVIPEALGEDPVTREQLADRVVELLGLPALGEALRSGWAAVLKPAANWGLLCQGPPAENAITFVDPARWLGWDGRAPEPVEAIRAVLMRFLDAYGPATAGDFARWFGVTPKAGKEVLAAHADELAAVDVEGLAAWMTTGGATAAAVTGAPEGVILLPGFDPYVIAPISHRDHVIPAGHVSDVSRSAGWISPVVVIDGRIAGTWSHERQGEGTRVVIVPFASPAPDVAAAVRSHLEMRHATILPGPYEIEVQGHPS